MIRDAFFEKTEREHPGTLEKLRNIQRSKLGASVSNVAINRSVFSHCIFEVEDSVLSVVDKCLRELGWAVGSLIYDGMHVEHRGGDTLDPTSQRWIQLESAMRKAEAAVLTELGYSIKLCEKPLFQISNAGAV